MRKFLLSFLLVQLCIFSSVAQKEYYTSVDGVKGGATLKTALYNLVKNHTRISYGSGSASTWGAFYSTDRNPENNQVYDMYSSTVRYFGEKGKAISGMNIEHSVAKSWWGGAENNAYHDLHHLNPSDQGANSRKSNFPMAELETVSWDNGVTFVGKATINGSLVSAYEPCDEYKGDFARTFMYMFTCYQDLTYKYTWMNYENSTYPTLKPWAVELLLKWNKQDPVSQKEIDRNNAVYEIQGNRNPYIDYPQLAEYVWGDSVDYVFNLDGAVLGGGGDVPSVDGNVHIMEAFSSSFGTFAPVETVGEYPWVIQYGCARATSYVSNKNYAAESWLVSQSIDFSEAGSAVISFDYVAKYNQSGKVAERNQLLISDDYAGDVEAATWVAIDFGIKENSTDWAFSSTGDVPVPAEFMGKAGVTIAFKYTGTSTKAGTWQVKNVVLTSTKADGDNTGDGDNVGGDTGGDNTGGNVDNDGAFTGDRFTLVTDEAMLTPGDSIIFVYTDCTMGAQYKDYRLSVSGVVVEGNVIASYPEGTSKFVLEEGVAEGSFAFNEEGLYLASVSNSKNYLHSLSTLNEASSWVVTIGDDSFAVIEAQGSFTRSKLQYNTSSPRFSCYTGTQKSVTIYAKSPASATSVDNLVAEGCELVDVYTLSGVCVKGQVVRSEALNGLPCGIYLVGGEKVYKR